MKPNPRLLVAALLLGVAACGSPTTPAAPTPPSAPAPAASPAFGGTDLAWIEINIAMDEELLPLLALTPGSSPLKELSAQVKAFTDEELATLRQLHAEAGLPAENQHKGMPMPGMVTPSLLASATAARGAGFDALLAKALREHLEQGKQLATSERSAGAESRTKALAERILKTRESALAKLQKDF
ncbi:hypothetical protein BJY16_007599 [Actinoplanes octamycinicus]|uniref:DUF305 domain-containing protein n=1 Tax=Actinoplanes octamycinicus TaxID=135948 RepID=A0A7W7H4Z7_9ACTN|nr:DUF305 domain-containing protein [Actinoplanes octamycinicus]MBB4744140.1 hypothetical protein [Actinoplanes octamycinicus]GIE56904.1 DUF305 domain-containing protein [Actinoplanes octamycinicus]